MPRRRAATDAASTRSQILARLRSGSATVDELALLAGVTRNGVRAQLAVLERDGQVVRQGVRHSRAAGKPALVFAVTPLAEEQLSRAYQPALAAVVEVLAKNTSAPRAQEILGDAGRQLALELPPATERSPAAVARRVLESLGALVTTSGDGREQLVEGAACPLARVVRRHPECCEMVRALLASATNTNVAMRCMHGDRPRCRFALG